MNINSWKIPEKELGKYFASYGNKVVTRFPPEPSGYLHLGHIKALSINYVLAKRYGGKVLLRFDDTNPKNETQEYEDAILEDAKTLGIDFDNVSRTSDYFDKILEYATNLVKNNQAYVDLSTADEIKDSRKTGKETDYRLASTETNLNNWNSMIANTCHGILRIKLDMTHKNNTMRDPTIFRVLDEEHYRTGNKYYVYPSYDFSCPIVDSLEGVTHVLRSTEFADRDIQYLSILDKLELSKPLLFSYGRVNIEDALMSKRKIKEGILNGSLEGWNDCSLYTIRGLLRRGLTLNGLFEYVATLGFSKNTVNMKSNKLWAMNRKYIDSIATRINGVSNLNNLVMVSDLKIQFDIPKYSKNHSLGNRKIVLMNEFYVDDVDIVDINSGFTLGFALVPGVVINKDHNGNYVANKIGDATASKKINWVPKDCVKINIINVNNNKTEYYVEPCVREMKKGDIIQICRVGYFICDDLSNYKFIEIPDGK